MSTLVLIATDPTTLAVYGTIAVAIITAVVGPILIAIVNHLLKARDQERGETLEAIETLGNQVKALQKRMRAIERKAASEKASP